MQSAATQPADRAADEAMPEVELSDEDILDAMRHVPGYLDITPGDFREVYHLALRHAVERLLGGLRARKLMHPVARPLSASMMLDEAARTLVASGFKALPVTDEDGRVIGVLTESDFLRRLQAESFLELLLRLIEDSCELSHRCHETPVREAMTAPAVTVTPDAGFGEIMGAFRRHAGRSMPVTDAGGRLLGLLFRKDYLESLDRETRR